MTITINLHTLMIPLVFTAISFFAVCITAFLERNDTGCGWLSGIGTVFVAIAAAVATVVAWIVWGLMSLLK